MRLVDREQAEHVALVQALELREEARCGHALGRRVQQRKLAAHELAFDALGLCEAERGVQIGRAHPRLGERAHLIVHQGDERAYHQAHPRRARCCTIAGTW